METSFDVDIDYFDPVRNNAKWPIAPLIDRLMCNPFWFSEISQPVCKMAKDPRLKSESDDFGCLYTVMISN